MPLSTSLLSLSWVPSTLEFTTEINLQERNVRKRPYHESDESGKRGAFSSFSFGALSSLGTHRWMSGWVETHGWMGG